MREENSYVIRATCKIKIINNMFCPLISAYPHSQTADVACSNKEDADADADVARITNADADADADADIFKMRIIRGCGCGCEYPIHH